MVRAPCCEKMGLKKGPWTPEEDQVLVAYIRKYGHGNWRALPKQAGLLRCGKSCRLRWTNYLRPDIKRGNFSREEEESIIQLHEMLGNRWSAIAARLPGRTDNEIKNVWHTHLKKRLKHNSLTANQSSNSTQVADDKAKQVEETINPLQYTESSVPTTAECENSIQSPVSPQQSSSNFSFSSAESSSILTCENRDAVASVAEDEYVDSLESNWMQASNSIALWPENLSEMDEFWLETFKEEKFDTHNDNFPASNAIDPAYHVPLSPLPFSMYQDNNMDFWLNVLMEAGQMQLRPEF